MPQRTLILGLWFFSQSLLAAALGSSVDDRQQALDSRHPAHLRWEQVEAIEPLTGYAGITWEDGDPCLRLEAGERAVIRLAPEESLRLRLEQGDRRGLMAFLSEGSGLFQQISLQWEEAGRQALVAPQGASRWVLVEAEQAISLSLYRGRFEPRAPQLGYERLLSLPAPSARLTQLPGLDRQPVWPLAPGRVQALDIEGPMRVKLSSWPQWPEQPLARQIEYGLEFQLDDQPWRRRQVLSWPTLTSGWTIDGQLRALGREDRHYLEIPPGSHRLQLKVDHPLWVNLIGFAPVHYLFPGQNPMTRFDWAWSRWLGAPELLEGNLVEQAWTVAQDNREPEGVFRARRLLEGADHGWLQRARRQVAQQIDWRHGFFRDLPPVTLADHQVPQRAYFDVPQLADREGERWPLPVSRYLSQSQWIAQWRNIPSGWPHRLAQSPAAGVYPLPPRRFDSELQLAILLRNDEGEQRLWLQFDQQPPRRVLLLPQSRSWGWLEPSLARLSERLTGTPGLTLSHRFAQVTSPAPLVAAAVTRLPLPAGVTQVRWWSDSGPAPLQGALAYRAGRDYRLSEQAYVNLLQPLSIAERLQRLQQWLNDPAVLKDGAADPLGNQWLPLLRWLNARREAFEGENDSETAPSAAPLAGSEARSLLKRAQRAVGEQRWLDAFGDYAAVADGAGNQAPLQLRAWQGQLDALQQLGERGLWLAQLKRTLIGGSLPLRQAALTQLEQHYRQQEDEIALGGLWSHVFAVADAPQQPHWIRQLSRNLQARGEYQLVLDLQLLLAPVDRDHPLLVRAAYHQGWRQTFEQSLSHLPEARQALWRGHWAMRQGKTEQALRLWQQAGDEGTALIVSWRQGWRLRQQREDAPATSLETDWGRWRAGLPGHRAWQPLPRAVQQAAGGGLLFSQPLQRFGRAYAFAPDRPARLRVAGPVRLRFNLRLRHGAQQPVLQDWLEIRAAEQRWGYPLESQPAGSVTLIGDSTQSLGQSVPVELSLGEGVHSLELKTHRYPALFGVEAWLPTEPLNLDAVAGPREEAPEPPYLPRTLEVIDACPLCQPHSERFTASEPGGLPALSRDISETFPPPLGSRTAVWLDGGVSPESPGVWEDQVRALWVRETGSVGIDTPAEPLSAAPVNSLLSRRLEQGYRWRLLNSPIASAGLRYRELQGWQPESPALQLRKRLLAGEADDSLWVRGDEVLSLQMRNPRTTEVELRFRLRRLSSSPETDARLGVAVNDRPEQSLAVGTGDWQQQRVTLATGVQRLSLRWLKPHRGLYLELQLRERSPGGPWQALNPRYRRAYLLATPQEPLELFVQGPQLLRVHRWDEAGEQIRYQKVAAGPQRVRLAPARGEVGYRVFLRERDPSPPLPPAPAQPQPVLFTAGEQPPRAAGEGAPLFIDWQSIDHDDRGTESLYMGWQRRRDFESNQDTEQFLELGGRYRYYSEPQRLFGRLDAFWRDHQRGADSQGLRGRWQWRPEARPWTLSLDSQLMHQPLDGVLSSADEWAWSALAGLTWERQHALGPASEHRVSVQARHRWMSLKQLAEADQARVDQDLFTRYKVDHAQQLILEDRWRYRPWLDSEVSAGAGLASNAPYRVWDPDNLGFDLGWRQMLGSGSLNLNYSRIHRFADRHRVTNSQGQRLRLTWQQWFWRRAEQGWQLRLSTDFDLERQDWQGRLEFSWNRSGGRGYEDFMPREIDFYRHRRPQPFQQLQPNRIGVGEHE